MTEASNGPHALLELERSSAELMLLDFAMPGMNGAELAAEALALRPDLKLVFVTGYADSEAIDRAVAGRARVLKKPVSASNLFGVIETLIDWLGTRLARGSTSMGRRAVRSPPRFRRASAPRSMR